MGKRHPEETIELGLTVLALSGDDTEKAVKMLASQGTRLSSSTLCRWRQKHTDRYEKIRQGRAPQIEREIIDTARALAIGYAELEREATEATRQKIRAGELKDPSGAMRNAAVAKAVNVDKMLLMEGRPTERVEHIRSRDDIFAELERDGLIDSTAEEVPFTELNDGTVVPLPQPGQNPTEGRSGVGGSENAPGHAA